jgi:hypothetical protein
MYEALLVTIITVSSSSPSSSSSSSSSSPSSSSCSFHGGLKGLAVDLSLCFLIYCSERVILKKVDR